MRIEVIIPWRDGCEHRRRALTWALDAYARVFPGWQVTVAEHHSGPWVKALAVMPAVAASSAEVIVVADADVWLDRALDRLHQAVEAVTGEAAWAVPHGKVHRLTPEATSAVYGGRWPGERDADALSEPAYYGVAAGGLLVLPRAVALDTPLDPRFEGWGGEDHAWGYALGALWGRPWRSSSTPLWHLWHPTPERLSRMVGSHASENLRRRYRDARVQAAEMRRVVAEVPTSWPAG